MAQKYNAEEVSRDLPGYLAPSRRKCRNCGKVMRPFIEWRDAAEGESGVKRYVRVEIPVRVLWYGRDANRLFCTLRCGYAWAIRHHPGQSHLEAS